MLMETGAKINDTSGDFLVFFLVVPFLRRRYPYASIHLLTLFRFDKRNYAALLGSLLSALSDK